MAVITEDILCKLRVVLQDEKPSSSRQLPVAMANDPVKEEICVEPESEFLIKVLLQYR
jgi:hypothetical protein